MHFLDRMAQRRRPEIFRVRLRAPLESFVDDGARVLDGHYDFSKEKLRCARGRRDAFLREATSEMRTRILPDCRGVSAREITAGNVRFCVANRSRVKIRRRAATSGRR